MNIIVHPITKQQIVSLQQDPPQALLVCGDSGVGLSTIAAHIASDIGKDVTIVLPEKDEKVSVADGVISVKSIRNLYDLTRTKRTSRHVVIIDFAEKMAPTAQNAFLKLLEEPNADTYFILVTSQPDTLLPTVISRVQRLDVKHITTTQSEELLDALKVSGQKRTQMLFIADGLPSLLTRLATDDAFFETRVVLMRDARDLLQANLYKKLLIAHRYKDDRAGALSLVRDAISILRRTISDAPSRELIAQIEPLLLAYDKIEANGNIRLSLARLVV